MCNKVLIHFTAEATVTITAPSSPPCFDGEPYKLTCTHPVLATSTLLWEKDGVFLSTTASATHQSVETTPTTTTLTITVTREEFENKVYTYRCYTADQVTNERVYSNNSITVDPPGKHVCIVSVLAYYHNVQGLY